jgi:hypothetical protein
VFIDEEDWFIITKGLNSCTGVIVISPFAYIIAHIYPRHLNDPRPTAGDENALHIIAQVANWFEQFGYNNNRSSERG